MGRLGSQLRVTDLDSNPARSWSIRVWKECTRDRDRGMVHHSFFLLKETAHVGSIIHLVGRSGK